MNSKRSKLRHEQREEQTADLQQISQGQSAREFESVEQVLREDAASIEVPAAIEERLSRSVQQQPGPKRSWWNRWRTR